jgi:hypothetical protein
VRTFSRGRERLKCGREWPTREARTSWGGRKRPRGGHARFSRGRARLGGARTARGSQGSREWRQGGGFGRFAYSSLLLASSLHDWLTFGFSIQEIS